MSQGGRPDDGATTEIAVAAVSVTVKPLERAGSVFGALWLVAWFVACLFGILCTMAAQDFQKRLTGATDTTKYSVGYALDQVDELERRRDYWLDRTKALQTAQATESTTGAIFQQALATAGDARAALETTFGEIVSKLPPGPTAVAVPLGDGTTMDDFFASLKFARAQLQAFESQTGPAPAVLQKSLGTAQAALRDFGMKVRKLQVASAAWVAALNAVSARQKDVDGAFKNLSAPPFDNRDFEQLTDDLSRYNNLLLGVPFGFVKFPGIALTLLLTVLMGILGSLISMARSLVFENAQITIGEYLFRLGLGASVALAVFFFTGVGALTLAQSSVGDHGVEPSPYIVSFFGIIAGYLSRRVTAWMKETGSRTFPVREDADRWAIDLKAALDAAHVAPEGLKEATGLGLDKIQLWIDRKEAIPNYAQSLIAAYVRQPAYQLFSDVAPPP